MYKQEILLDNAKIAEMFANVDLNTFMPDGGMAIKNKTVTLPRVVTVPLASIEAFGVDKDYIFSLSIFDHYFSFSFNKSELKKLNKAYLKKQEFVTFIWLDLMPEEVSPASGERFCPVKVMFKE